MHFRWMDFIFGRALPTLLALFALAGCSSSSGIRRGTQPDEPEGLHVDPSAYGADSFTYNKPMVNRPRTTDVFYFKHCDQTGHQTWYSKTDYFCTYPY